MHFTSFRRFARSVLGWALLLVLTAALRAGETNFANYDVPLHEQITNRIKAKVTERLGEGKNLRDRYFIVPFAYENQGNDPEFSHTFVSVIRVLADGQQPRVTAGLQRQTYRHRNFEAFTISWLPQDFAQNPNLCVFSGFGARLFPQRNACATSVGRVFTLAETLQLGVNARNAICLWGPYEIRREAFDLAVARLRLLQGGTIKYRADDRLTRKDRSAINCFHATANIYELYPNGGLFGTGFNMWGINGTTRVLIEYTKAARNQGLLLEPVDVKADRYGFVHAPTRSGRGVYNPFKTAFAYHR